MSKGLLGVAVIAPAAILLLVMFQQAGGAHQPPQTALAATTAVIQGDVNCSGGVDSIDSLQILRSTASLPTTADCLGDAGDVDCSGAIDSVDALRILRYVASLNVQTPEGCTPIGEPMVLTPEAAAHALAQRIVHPASLLAGVHSVEQALSRAGVASGTFAQILVPARDPATPEVDLPMGVLNLALEAKGDTLYRMTAADLGQMLADFGWPFADGATPGKQVVAMLAALINGAHEAPDDPVSFGALLLDELGKLKDPPLDLTAGTPAPEDVRLNLLDLKLVSSLFDRTSVKSEPSPAAAAVPAGADPCTDAKKTISGATGSFGGQIYGLSTSQTGPGLVERGLEAAGVSKQNAGNVGKGLAALSIAAKIWKLVEFYSSAQVNVTLVDSAKIVHKALASDDEQLKLFKAAAGVSDEDWQEYVDSFDAISRETNSAVRDCLNEFGLNVPADLGEIAKDAENWKIEWALDSGFNARNEPNAFWSVDAQLPPGSPHLGHWQSSLHKVSDFSAEASFIVDIGTELESDHPSPQKLDNVNVCADVISATPPNLQTFFNATQGILGLVDAIVELGAGWLQTVAPPHACAVIGVTWHEKCALAPQSADAATSPAPQAQPLASVSIQAITSLDELPCTWTGTSTASTHYFGTSGLDFDEVGSVAASFTFGNPQRNGVEVKYQITGGQAQWHASGHYSSNHVSCPPFSKGGTQGLSGQMTVAEYTPGNLTYSIDGWMNDQDRAICSTPNQPGINTNAFLETFLCAAPALTGESLSGSCQHDDTGLLSAHLEYDWNLTSAGCQPSPQPVCQ